MHVINKKSGRVGSGSWDAFPHEMFAQVEKQAKNWQSELSNIDRPWLCWAVQDDLCKLQQALVKEVGWTPVVGHDTNIKPTILPGSHYIDFNSQFKFDHLRMFFPLEFVFLFVEKIAFWHSDFLMSLTDMRKCATAFETLRDSEMAMVWNRGRLFGLRDRHANKWYALVGCTTKAASKEQFELGCGFWRHIERHPNFRSEDYKKEPFYDHEIGITNWNKKYGGKIIRLSPSVIGHMTSRECKHIFSKEEDLTCNFDLRDMCKKLKIEGVYDNVFGAPNNLNISK